MRGGLGDNAVVVALLASNDVAVAWHFALLRLGVVCGEKEVGERK